MYRFKKILVGMDLSDRDSKILNYAGFVTRLAESEQIRFLHVSPTLDIPEEIRKMYPQLIESPVEYGKKRLHELTGSHFHGFPDTERIYEIDEGNYLDQVLQRVRDQDIDLVILGKHDQDEHGINLAEKIARKAPCSVLIIPEDCDVQIEKILVALDFSSYSANAVDVGVAFAKACNLSVIEGVHAYQVPTGYYKTGKTFDEFAAIMEKHARGKADELKQEFSDAPVHINIHFVLDKNPARAISQIAESEGIDLLVLSARGRSAGAAVLLGSVTEKIIANLNIPVLAVKKKDAGMGLIDALLQ